MTSVALSVPARRYLLELARSHVVEAAGGDPAAPGPAPPETLARRGAFVTLRRRRDHELRGCIGQVEPRTTLAETVAQAAEAAACRDPRFEPVGPAEVRGLAIEVSVLTSPVPIRPEAVEVGRHGLIVRAWGRSGLLLPQVPVEQGWAREEFLAHTCRKAGLPADAWTRPGTEILGFEAEVFSEGAAGP